MEILELHLIFAGRVQGVGFRATARTIALDLGITGAVRNLPDGTVELLAQAPKEILERFIDTIQKRFPSSYHSILTYVNPTKKFPSFEISFPK